MAVYYHQFAGRSLDRLAALSDGIFAVAMTILVLDLRVPVVSAVHSQHLLWQHGALRPEHALLSALTRLAPRLLIYGMSFLTLGMYWVGQQTHFGLFERTDRNLTWIQLAFLLGVTLMPFSTALLGEFTTYRLALIVYWLNLLLLGLVLWWGLRYARRAGLLKQDVSAAMYRASVRRITVAQVLYAISVLFCVIDTYVSIALIVALQLNSALGSRLRPLNRF